MTFIIILIVVGIIGILLFFKPIPNLNPRKLKLGDKLINSKGKHYTVDEHGALRNTETIGEFLNHPKVKKQLDAFDRLYMQQTLMALYDGIEPPNQVGGYGILTKKKLMSVWNDKWQAELDKMNEYYDVTYDSFFNVPTNGNAPSITAITASSTAKVTEYSPVSIILTSEEILAEYGSKKES